VMAVVNASLSVWLFEYTGKKYFCLLKLIKTITMFYIHITWSSQSKFSIHYGSKVWVRWNAQNFTNKS